MADFRVNIDDIRAALLLVPDSPIIKQIIAYLPMISLTDSLNISGKFWIFPVGMTINLVEDPGGGITFKIARAAIVGISVASFVRGQVNSRLLNSIPKNFENLLSFSIISGSAVLKIAGIKFSGIVISGGYLAADIEIG